MPYEDDDWDDPDADEFSAPGYGSDNDTETVTCPYCHEEVYEDTVRCPRCENYLSKEDAPPARQPWWIVIGILAVLGIVALWVFRGW
jgi:uncharacterized paraquat-inducible protein A